MKINSLNLSLSTKCTANCVFCPSNRGKDIKPFEMPFSLVKKIVKDIEENPPENIQISENGDCFLNKDVLKVLRLLKAKLHNSKIKIFTNFFLLSKDVSDVIISEDLVDSISFNLDSTNPRLYKIIKGLNLEKVLSNLDYFVKERDRQSKNIELRGMVISLNRYIHSVSLGYNTLPVKLNSYALKDINVENDEWDTYNFLKGILNGNRDSVQKPHIVGWAECEVTKTINSKPGCPFTERIFNELFIAPNGKIYVCCLDHNAELSIGNANKENILEVFNSKKRIKLINDIRNGKNMHGPCKDTVKCQTIGM